MDEYKTLFQRLAEFSGSEATAMHMPGHKRNSAGLDFLEKLGARYDLTEIEGFDDLHNPEGILKDAMERAAQLWGSERCFFLVNGSTGGILAAIRAAALATGSERLIMARNSHRSVYNAVELLHLEPIYLAPPITKGFGFCASISPKSVELSVRDNPGTPVILTSPNFEGVISNISEVAIICHLYGSPLIVDSAHGAHLDLSKYFTGGAISAGADIVIQSVHKTLTGLNQTALLHLNGDQIPEAMVKKELSVFQTSSPSYPLMASIDGTVDLLTNKGYELLSSWSRRLDNFDRRVSGLQKLKIPGHSEFFPCQSGVRKAGYVPHMLNTENIYDYDRSKIVISCENTDTTGPELMNRLQRDYKIYCEMASSGYVVAMTGIGDREQDTEKLAVALNELDRDISSAGPRLPYSGPEIPPRRMPADTALNEPSRSMALRDACGRISAEYVWCYPPGIPIVVPGEELTEDIIAAFVLQRDSGLRLQSTSGEMPRYIRVVK